MLSQLLVHFYRAWHGKLRLPGSGYLISRMAPRLKGLQRFRIQLPEGHSLWVDFRDVSGAYWVNHLLGDRFEEHGLLIAIQRWANGNGVLWDVGGNSGLLAYQAARSGAWGEIHVFEPNPGMHELASTALSPFEKLQVHHMALSDQKARITLTIPSGQSTKGTLEATPDSTSGTQCLVECETGDSLVFEKGFRAPNVIKIDTEGHEPAVLSGLSRILELHQPIVFFENIGMTQEEIDYLVPRGYLLHTVSDEDGTLIRGYDPKRGHNSVFMPEKHC